MSERILIAKELGNLFSVIAHQDRIRIIEELGIGEKDVQSLSELLGVSPSRMSQHLSKLKSLKIVDERREQKHHFYRLHNPTFAKWVLSGLEYSELSVVNPERLTLVAKKAKTKWLKAKPTKKLE